MKNGMKKFLCFFLIAQLWGCAKESDESLLEKGSEAFLSENYTKAVEYYEKVEGDLTEEALRNLLVCYKDENKKLIDTYSVLLNHGCFTSDDYLSMSLAFNESQLVEKRNLLEEGFCIYHNDAMFQELSQIVVPVELESEELKNRLTSFYNEETTDITPILGLFQSNALERKYRVGEGRIYIDANGIQIWKVENETVKYIRINQQEYFIGNTTLIDGQYKGAFDYIYATSEGSVVKEVGTFTNNLCTGELESTVYQGDSENVVELVQNRESYPSKNYTGEFDAEGHTEESQKTTQGITYASNKTATSVDYVYLVSEESAKDFVFSANSISFREVPLW